MGILIKVTALVLFAAVFFDIGPVNAQQVRLLEGHPSDTEPRDFQFIQVSSHAHLADAVVNAESYAAAFPTVEVFSTRAGFYAVVLGTVDTERAQTTIQQLLDSGEVPNDTYATAGRRFIERVWKASWSDDRQEASDEYVDQDKDVVSGFGTGFAVSYDGHFLTNAHVVSGCTNLSIDGYPAQLISKSEHLDLALLLSADHPAKNAAMFSPSPARLNSDVTVVGFPLAGILFGINVTRGSVSSQLGFGGDVTGMQITAPVQPGSSGGPVLATDGEVVGVVVSKLDAQFIAEMTGDIPQNVNFAIRGEVAKLFLFQNGVEPILGRSDEAISPTKIAEMAGEFTGSIACN